MKGLASLRFRRPFANRPDARRRIWWQPVVKDNPYRYREREEKKKKKLKNRCHLRNTGLLDKNHEKLVDNQLPQAVGKSGLSCRLCLVLSAKEMSLCYGKRQKS